MSSEQQAPFIGKPCLSCPHGHYSEPSNGQEWHVTCNQCGAILFVYVPMPHQADFHKDPHQFKLYAGGFGSAKTSTCAAEMIQHVLETPRGMTLVGAATFPQLEETAKKTFMEMFPQEFIDTWSEKHQRLTAINGHRVIFRPLDDEGKVRSLNLTAFWIEESSEVGYDFFVQLQTRLRNRATKHHKGLLSSNPDQNWIKTEFLLKSDAILGGDVAYNVDLDTKNKNFVTYIAETSRNIHLPHDYEEKVAAGKPDWWVRRYLKGSFENKEGLVYPQFEDNIVDDFEIPKKWPRYFALDFGINHPTAALWAAVDEKEGKVYFYDEHYVTDKPVNYHARIINTKNKDIAHGVMRSMVGDPKGNTRTNDNLSSTFDSYAEHNIYLQVANNKIDDGIQKVYDFLDRGAFKFFKSLRNLRWEGQNYRYPERKVNDNRKDSYFDKPIDKDNHLMDCFIAGTLLETNNGQVPIEKIKKGDLVKTRKGFRKVLNSGLASPRRNLIEVEFSNGSVLIGTKEHLVWTENRGFVELDSLRYFDIIRVSNTWSDVKWKNQKLKYIKGKNTEGILALQPCQINDTIKGLVQTDTISTSTGKFIKTISEKYPRVGTFITKMAILTTIHLKISKLLARKITHPIMENLENMTLTTLKESGHSQKNGTLLKKVANGMLTTLKRLGKTFNPRLETVISAVNLMNTSEQVNSVQITVNQHGEELQGSITYKENVNHVENTSQSISIIRKNTVRQNAVYNITVDDCHEFYANGILVHNCLRYIAMELPNDVKDLKNPVYSRESEIKTLREQQKHLPHALQDEFEEVSGDWYSIY